MADTERLTDKMARYSEQGQLSCAICKINIKNNQMWSAHTSGSMHNEKLRTLTQLLQQQKAKQNATLSTSVISNPIESVVPVPAKPVVVNAVVNTMSLVGYGSEDEDEEEETDKCTQANTVQTVVLVADNNVSEMMSNDDDYVSDIDIDTIEVPLDYNGDPDEYLEEQHTLLMARKRELKRIEQSSVVNNEVVEVVDDEGRCWRLQGDEFIEVGVVDSILETNKVSSGYNDSNISNTTESVVISGDFKLEMAQFDKEMKQMKQTTAEERENRERLRDESEKQSILDAEAARVAQMSSVKARIDAVVMRNRKRREQKEHDEHNDVNIAVTQAVLSKKAKTDDLKSDQVVSLSGDTNEDDEDDDDFDAEALFSWRSR